MSLEIFARQTLAGFISIYSDIYDGKAIPAEELEAAMWGRMCAKQAGVIRAPFKVPFDNIRRAKVNLPYMPDVINYNGCPVIKKNGGLYTPCCGKVAEDAFYCKTCSVDKKGHTKTLEFGTTDTRAQNIEDGRFTPISYGDWLKKSKTSLPEVYAKLSNCGVPLEIPAGHLVCETPKPKIRKGRPAKAVDEDSSESDEPKAKKPRAKKAKVESSDSGADSSESDEPKAKKPRAKKAKVESSDSEAEPAPKAKKAKQLPKKPSPKVSPAASPESSDNEEPQKPKKKPKAPKAEKAAKEPKAEKAAKEPRAEKPKAKPKTAPEPESEEEEERIVDMKLDTGEDEEEVVEQAEIDGKVYDIKNDQFVCDHESGKILAKLNKDGDAEWLSEER